MTPRPSITTRAKAALEQQRFGEATRMNADKPTEHENARNLGQQEENEYDDEYVTTDVLLAFHDKMKNEVKGDMLQMKKDLMNAIEAMQRVMMQERTPTIPQPSISRRSSSPVESQVSEPSSATCVKALEKALEKAIPDYTGEGGPQKLFEFIQKVDSYFEHVEYTPKQELQYAVVKLTNSANLWWRSHLKKTDVDSPHLIRTWQQLKAGLIQMFTPPEHSMTVREKLQILNQKGSVTSYNTAFMQMTMQLADMSEEEAKYAYLRGLNKEIRAQISTHAANLESVESLQLAAVRQENAIGVTTTKKRDDGALLAHSVDYDNSNGGRVRHRGRLRRGQEGRSDHAYHQRDMSKIKCHLCDKVGHFMTKCPQISEAKKLLKNPSSKSNEALIARSPDSLIIDSGATQHMMNQRDWFHPFTPKEAPVTVGNNDRILSEGVGTVEIEGDNGSSVQLNNVLYVPHISANLISVTALTQEGNNVIFKEDGTVEVNRDGELILHGQAMNNLFYVSGAARRMNFDNTSFVAESELNVSNYILWHHRLGHPGRNALQQISHLVDGLDNVDLTQQTGIIPVCNGCEYAKAHRQPFGNKTDRATKILELVHSDLCGPQRIPSINGALYALTFIDDATRFSTIYFIKKKSDVFSKFKQYKALIENQTGQSIKSLRSDGGGEYCNEEMLEFLIECGIRHETTAANTPQQNGVAERFNRTLFETTLALMHAFNIPQSLWAELASTAVYLRNRLPTRANKNGTTPFELWYGRKPCVSHLRVIWSDAYAYVHKKQRGKLDKRAFKYKMLGYHDTKKAYRLWDTEKATLHIARIGDVKFDESIVLTPPASPVITHDDEYIVDCILDEREDETGEKQYLIKWSGYEDTTWEPYCHIKDLAALDEWERRKGAAFAFLADVGEPLSVKEALSSPEAALWQAAIDKELDALEQNKTWCLVDTIPAGRQPIGCKWVFRRKYNADGSIERYKARLVAKGYAQQYGVDYDETFAPVAKFVSIRAVLAIGAALNLEIHQFDVITAFLHGELEEDIYMIPPAGLSTSPNVFCKLLKSLYGLKQSPRMWNKKLDDYLRDSGFQRLSSDYGVYLRRNDNELVIIAVYVDDLIALTDSIATMNKIKADFSKTFAMTDGGEIHHCLGIQVHRDRSRRFLSLNQERYIEHVLARFGMSACRPVKTPLDPSTKLTKYATEGENDVKLTDQSLYQQIVGSLMYLMIATRPDIANSVSIVSQFAASPTNTHMQAVKHILRYLRGTSTFKLNYGPNNDAQIVLTGFSDSDWANDVNTRRSTTGYAFFLCGGVISWSSKRQRTVALSTTEAEYMALTQTTKEAIWLRRLLEELGFAQTTTTIYEDNESSISLARNPVQHARTKHIDIQYHFTREKIESKDIRLEYLPTDRMLADIMTKPLSPVKFKGFVDELNLRTSIEEKKN